MPVIVLLLGIAVWYAWSHKDVPPPLSNPKYKTKQGEYGTLYLYGVPYHEPGTVFQGIWTTWAYDEQDALERFYEEPASDDFVTGKPRRKRERE